MDRVYIHDFVDELNYHAVILYVDPEVDLDELLSKLREDLVSHLYRFDSVRENRLFYIENCDLQDVTINSNWNELLDLLSEGYSVLQLKKDISGFYAVVPDIYEMRRAKLKGENDEN